MAAHSLKAEHHLCQFFNASGSSFATLADFPVYAKDTSKRTISEEDSSRASFSNKGFFFSEMRVISRNLELGRSLTEALIPIESVGLALSWAELTAFHYAPEFFRSFFQLSTSV
jgi:hypothetical protein